MARPTRIEQLVKAGISTDGLSKEDITSEWLKLPADGSTKKALLKYGISSEGLSGFEAKEALKKAEDSSIQPTLIDRAYKIEIDPTDFQLSILRRYVGIARHVYNWTWRMSRECYFKTRKIPDISKLGSEYTKLLQDGIEPEWVSSFPSRARREAHGEVKLAYKHAFRRLREGKRGKKVGWPKKRKRFGHLSYNANQPGEAKALTLSGHDYIKLPGVAKEAGLIRSKEDGYLPIDLKINAYAYSCIAGKYYVSLTYRVARPEVRGTHSRGEVGIDPGVKTALTLSDGTKYEAPHPLLAALKKLRRAQRRVYRAYEARKIRNGVIGKKAKGPIGSNEVEARQLVAKIHAEVTRIRRDWQQKLTLSLVRKYSVIRIQVGFKDWVVKGNKTKAKFNRKALDIGLGEICRELKYKCDWYGCIYEEVDQFFPSTQLCSCCGDLTGPKDLQIRSWICSSCNTKHDRDVNSAKNIKDFPLWSKDDSGWHRMDCPVKLCPRTEEGSVPRNGQSGSYDDPGLVTRNHQGHLRSKEHKAPATHTGGVVTNAYIVHERERLGATQITGGARTSEIIAENTNYEALGQEANTQNLQALAKQPTNV